MVCELRRAVCEANLDLVGQGLITLTFGNASAIDREAGRVAIKPSGVSYDGMAAEQMAVVDLEGRHAGESLRPSSDTPTHLVLYNAWPGPGGIVHTHSTYATAFAQACMPIPCLGTTHADHFHGEVPVTRPLTRSEVETDYERSTGEVIVERFTELDPRAVPAVLVANHGPFTWGQSVDEAVRNAVALEAAARMALASLQLRPAMSPIPQFMLDKHYFRKHGPGAYYGQNHRGEP